MMRAREMRLLVKDRKLCKRLMMRLKSSLRRWRKIKTYKFWERSRSKSSMTRIYHLLELDKSEYDEQRWEFARNPWWDWKVHRGDGERSRSINFEKDEGPKVLWQGSTISWSLTNQNLMSRDKRLCKKPTMRLRSSSRRWRKIKIYRFWDRSRSKSSMTRIYHLQELDKSEFDEQRWEFARDPWWDWEVHRGDGERSSFINHGGRLQ